MSNIVWTVTVTEDSDFAVLLDIKDRDPDSMEERHRIICDPEDGQTISITVFEGWVTVAKVQETGDDHDLLIPRDEVLNILKIGLSQLKEVQP